MTTGSMADRFTRYEQATRYTLPRRTYTIMRLDGRGFSLFLRGQPLPCERFMHIMDLTAETLCQEISGSVFAYTQSDEISILIQDFANHNTEPWFGGVVQKMVSVAAGIASHHFHAVYGREGGTISHGFDARVFTLSDPVEVANYFVYRQRNCWSNAIGSLATKHLGHIQAMNMTTPERHDKLVEAGVLDLNDYFVQRFAYGRFTASQEYPDGGDFGGTWTRWSTETAKKFSASPGVDWSLSQFIPAMGYGS